MPSPSDLESSLTTTSDPDHVTKEQIPVSGPDTDTENEHIGLFRRPVPPRFSRKQATPRDDLEPGSEYALIHSRTPARDPDWHDPAVWDDDLVDWDSPNDPANPRNWSMKRKALVTVELGLTTMGASFASSSFSPAFRAIEEAFNISRPVATLSLSLYVLGFAFGPLAFAPLSEMYGRKISFLPAYFIFGIFLIAVATAENIQTVLLCRFFAGLMASAPISNVAGGLADMFDDKSRGLAVVLYSIAVIGGPTVGPLVGASITESYLGWRFTEYITASLIFFIFILDLFFLPETYGPILLQRKANHLRHTTGNWALHSKLDEKELTFKVIIETNLERPLRMLVTEPIILLLATYNAFVYGLLYLLFEAFPIAFEEVRGWSPVVSTLPFLAVLVGVLISAVLQASYQPYFWKQLDKAKAAGKHNNPEARLPPMILGGIFFTIGLFLFGWTSPVTYHWILPVIGATLIGAGFILIFQVGVILAIQPLLTSQNAVNYLIDAFTMHAASAQAANTFFRSLFGAGFPLFAVPMFHNLGVPWASSLLGFIAAAMIPIPLLFMIYGERLRKASRFTPVAKPVKA